MDNRKHIGKLLHNLSCGYETAVSLGDYKDVHDNFDKILELIPLNKNLTNISCGSNVSADNLLRLLETISISNDITIIDLDIVMWYYSDEDLLKIKESLLKTKKLRKIYFESCQDHCRQIFVDIVFAFLESDHQELYIYSRCIDFTDEEKGLIKSMVYEDPDRYRYIEIGKGPIEENSPPIFEHAIYHKQHTNLL